MAALAAPLLLLLLLLATALGAAEGVQLGTGGGCSVVQGPRSRSATRRAAADEEQQEQEEGLRLGVR